MVCARPRRCRDCLRASQTLARWRPHRPTTPFSRRRPSLVTDRPLPDRPTDDPSLRTAFERDPLRRRVRRARRRAFVHPRLGRRPLGASARHSMPRRDHGRLTAGRDRNDLALPGARHSASPLIALALPRLIEQPDRVWRHAARSAESLSLGSCSFCPRCSRGALRTWSRASEWRLMACRCSATVARCSAPLRYGGRLAIRSSRVVGGEARRHKRVQCGRGHYRSASDADWVEQVALVRDHSAVVWRFSLQFRDSKPGIFDVSDSDLVAGQLVVPGRSGHVSDRVFREVCGYAPTISYKAPLVALGCLLLAIAINEPFLRRRRRRRAVARSAVG